MSFSVPDLRPSLAPSGLVALALDSESGIWRYNDGGEVDQMLGVLGILVLICSTFSS